jgi:hypothetical protein
MEMKMKRVIFSITLLGALFLLGGFFTPGEVYDDFPKVTNKAFKVGEKLTFNVNYGFVTAGIATMQIPAKKKVAGRDTYNVLFQVNSVPSFDGVFKVRDRYESYLDVEGLFHGDLNSTLKKVVLPKTIQLFLIIEPEKRKHLMVTTNSPNIHTI